MRISLVPYFTLFLFLLALLPLQTNSVDRNIGIFFETVPESRVAPPGDRVFFDCKTNIGKGQQIRWLHNGNRLEKKNKHITISDGELTIKVRTTKRHRDAQTGRYQCVAGLEGQLLMSPPATLTVAHLDKFSERASLPSGMTANVGNTVLLPCQTPPSNPPAIIQWEKDGTMLNMTEDYTTLVSEGALLIQNLGLSQAGSYTCRASNHLTRESLLSPHPLALTVLPEGELHKPRLLTEPRTEYHAVQGESITIPCSASGSPKPTIVWEHEAFNQQPVVVYQDGPSELLHLANLTANSTGEYSCKIWNNRGRRILRKTLVFVAEKPRAIISSFSPEPHTEGGPLDLFCEAEGFPRPQVYWVVNGVRKHFGYSDQSSAKLLLTSLRLSDAGVYQCFAENRAGVNSDAVLVRVVPSMREAGGTGAIGR